MGLFDGLLGHGSKVDPAELAKRLDGVLLDDERPDLAFKIIRDFFVFTQWRLILVDIQGLTGSKVDYMTVPYKAITRFSSKQLARSIWIRNSKYGFLARRRPSRKP